MDASSFRKPGRSAVGGVLRNLQGHIKCMFSCPIRIIESNEDELLAINKALEISVSRPELFISTNSLILESDSRNIVCWVKMHSQVHGSS